jgi:hypothetical protein
MDILQGILIFAAIFVAIVTVSAVISIIGQGRPPSVEKYRPDDKQLAALVETARPHNTWAVNNGFIFAGCYKLRIAQAVVSMAVWCRTDRPTVLSLYIVRMGNKKNISTDIMTDFADMVSLTSNNSRAAQFSPWRPGR